MMERVHSSEDYYLIANLFLRIKLQRFGNLKKKEEMHTLTLPFLQMD